MNKERRKAIEEIASQIEAMKDAIENLTQEEQDYFDAMPESFQSGDKGQAAEQAISALEEAANYLDSAIVELSAASE